MPTMDGRALPLILFGAAVTTGLLLSRLQLSYMPESVAGAIDVSIRTVRFVIGLTDACQNGRKSCDAFSTAMSGFEQKLAGIYHYHTARTIVFLVYAALFTAVHQSLEVATAIPWAIGTILQEILSLFA